MPAQRNQRSTRPATTTRAGCTTARRGNGGNGNGRRNNRAADWPVELSIGTAVDLVVEGKNRDTGSEASQRSHTSWHETVLGIDSRIVR
jgi:hypothetical protein